MTMMNQVFERHGVGRIGTPKLNGNANGTSTTNDLQNTRQPEAKAIFRRPDVTAQDTALMSISIISGIMNIYFAPDNREVLHSLFFHHMLQENISCAARNFIALGSEIKMEHV